MKNYIAILICLIGLSGCATLNELSLARNGEPCTNTYETFDEYINGC